MTAFAHSDANLRDFEYFRQGFTSHQKLELEFHVITGRFAAFSVADNKKNKA